ncbi:MAG: FtsK/SpoIIIE domain-containing protein [Polyangiaceae bacterium]|nr:FtsK/SpoIIIE domain-containing protein [Polyangiaceae bacterium]
MSHFSVTEVRNALRCPRIFALGRRERSAVAFPIGSSCLGATFHRLVNRFATTLDAPPKSVNELAAGTPLDSIEAELRVWLLTLLDDELTGNATLATMPGEVDDLAQALRELAHHLAMRLRRFDGTPAQSLRRLVRESEHLVEATFEDGVQIRGTLDALYGEPDGSLEIIEYKLTDEANDALDRAQVALYGHMLKQARGLDAKPVVLRFMPMLRETSLSTIEAADLVLRTIRPLVRNMIRWNEEPLSAPSTERRDLCPACPLAEACAEMYPERVAPRDDPPAGAPRLEPAGAIEPAMPVHTASTSDEEGRTHATNVRDAILGELRKQGINAICPRPPVVGPTLFEIEVTRPRGSVRALDQAAKDVLHRLASENSIEADYEQRGGKRIYVVRRKVPRKVLLSSLLANARNYLSEQPGRFVLGEQPTGEVLYGDLSDSSTPHLLVGGTTGSGKSVLLRGIIASLIYYHGPSSIRFILIDPKRVTFNVPSFQSAVGSHLEGPIGYDADDAIPVIERLVEVMEERYEMFAAAHVSDIREYNEQANVADRLERKIVIIDEFQDLTAEKSNARPFFDGVKRLGAKARAAGVHLILATQRPDRDVVPPLLKTNLGGKIALRVASQINSRIILDEGGAERLLGKGDLLANLGHGAMRAQAAMM